MNGYKTGGDWADITSIGRNEVVFEGRHKDYGAFYIRQRYPNALFLSLLSAITFTALCALIPYVFRGISKLENATKTEVAIKPREVLIHREVILPPITPPHTQPPKFTIHRFAPPLLTKHLDSIPVVKPDERPLVPPGNPGTGDNKTGLDPVPDPGNPIPIIDDKPRLWVSEMPKFPGGDIDGYLQSKINYPAEENQIGVQGTVYASFVIEKDGSVSNVAILHGVANGPGLNKEALRVLSEMPKWTPGKQDGHPVRIQYTIPIYFKLR